MERLINVFIEERNKQKNENGGLTDGLNLKIKDPRINNIYKNVSNALISVDNATKEKDDIIQELLLAMWEVTPVFLANMETSLEELLEAIKKENNELAAKYFTYLNIRAVGAVKDKYKVTKDEKKKVVDEIFFKDVISGNFKEDEIADRLNLNNINIEHATSFLTWLKANGNSFLTRKQMNYLYNGLIGTTTQVYKMKKNISKRVLKNIAINDYSTSNIKKLELLDKVNILDNIINDFDTLKEYIDTNIVNDLIYSESFLFKELKEITLYINCKSSLDAIIKDKITNMLIIKRNKLLKHIEKDY